MSTLDIHEVMQHLPHRFPFLLVDRVVSFEPGVQIHAYKNVTINEPFFTGHFPNQPVMPGVLIIEALAQAAGILSFKTMGEKPDEDSIFYLVGVDGARFKKPVMPGDQLHLYVKIERQLRGIWKFKAQARVDDKIVTEADLMCAKREIER